MAAYPRNDHAPAPQWMSMLPYWAMTTRESSVRTSRLTRLLSVLRGLRHH
jgi:hypothetical protein